MQRTKISSIFSICSQGAVFGHCRAQLRTLSTNLQHASSRIRNERTSVTLPATKRLNSTTPAASLPPGENSAPSPQKKARIPYPQRPGQDPAELTAHLHKTAIEYPYFVPRNSNGCIPVYSDFKNNRTRQITLIRNVEGNVQALKEDLIATLFPDTPSKRVQNHRLKQQIRVHLNRHVVIQGGRWVNRVHKWLLARGF